MKKLPFLITLGLFFGLSNLYAQNILTQTNNLAPTNSTVACAIGTAPNYTGISASSYFRAYTITSNMNINSIRIGAGDVTGNFPITVKLHRSATAFPGSYPTGLTQLATATATLTAAQNESLVVVNFTNPVSVVAGEIIVAEVSNLSTDVANGGNGSLHFMGVVTTQTQPGYILTEGCGFANPTSFVTIDPAAKIVIDLIENTTASSAEFFKENFTIYPNPVVDVLNITSINELNVKEVRIIDMTGKVLNSGKQLETIDVSGLASGVYLIEIESNEGSATSKFIKN